MDNPTHKYCISSEVTAYQEVSYSWWRCSTSGDTKYLVQVGLGKGQYVVDKPESRCDERRWQSSSTGDYVDYIDGQNYYEATSQYATHKYFEKGYHPVSKGFGNRIYTTQGWNEVGEGYGSHVYSDAEDYVYVGDSKGNYSKGADNRFALKTTWDGFTIRDGYINSAGLAYLDGIARNGGAGVAIFTNVTLTNSVVTDNINENSSKLQIRGGGVYCDEGTLVNCYIQYNRLINNNNNNQATSYGGGVYMFTGTMYNCVISSNHSQSRHADGAAIFLEGGEFFNNTIVGNTFTAQNRGNGGICLYNNEGTGLLTIYNCIVMDNAEVNGLSGSGDIAISNNNPGSIHVYNSVVGNMVTTDRLTFNSCVSGATDIFVDYSNSF